MARTSILSTDTPDITAINLNLLLSRLERSVLSPEADPKLRHSSYERTRVGAVRPTSAVSLPLSIVNHLLTLPFVYPERRICTYAPPPSGALQLNHQDPIAPTSGAEQPPRPASPDQAAQRASLLARTAR